MAANGLHESNERIIVSAIILNGKELAAELQADLAVEVAEFIENNSVFPCLAAVLVGENPASEV